MQANMNWSSVVTITMVPMVRMATKTHGTTCCGGRQGRQGLALAEFPRVTALSEGVGGLGVVGTRLKGAKHAPSSQGDGAWGAYILLGDPGTKAPLTPYTLGQPFRGLITAQGPRLYVVSFCKSFAEKLGL